VSLSKRLDRTIYGVIGLRALVVIYNYIISLLYAAAFGWIKTIQLEK